MNPDTQKYSGRFNDRTEAGKLLAHELLGYADRADVIVLALPRGGVVTGFEIAQALRVPLDVLIVRKLGMPDQPELAMGAIASGGVRVLNESLLRFHQVPDEEIAEVTSRESEELRRREQLYRGARPQPDLKGKTVLLVDDGLATGTTMRSALAVLQKQQVAQIIIAVPVAPPSVCEEFRQQVGHIQCLCLATPQPFFAVGLWYEDFPQTSDAEVCELLRRAAEQIKTADSEMQGKAS